MSRPRLQLGLVKQMILQLIEILKREKDNKNPLKSLEAIAIWMNVPENDVKPIIQAIREHVRKISSTELTSISEKFSKILQKILKKVEKDFK